MDSRSRKALQAIYGTLPPGYKGEEYDDFINYTLGGRSTSQRVLRLVGKGRQIVLFGYTKNPYIHREYDLYFLKEDDTLEQFHPDIIMAEYRKARGRDRYFPVSWDRVVGEWLEEHGAKQYKGTNWVGRISADLVSLLPRWGQDLVVWDDGGTDS